MVNKGIYLCAYKDRHPNYDLIYNDVKAINGIDLVCDCLSVNLNDYDYIVATPPCNYWSRCNYRREISLYAQNTKKLLPMLIDKCCRLGKPFIIENVRNSVLFQKYNLYDFPCFVYIIGRHTYWTNILLPTDIEQRQDFTNGGYLIKYDDVNKQGGFNVHNVIDVFLGVINEY